MINLVIILISLATISFILLPLLKLRHTSFVTPSILEEIRNIERRIETSYREIETLMSDHDAGNINDEQFENKISDSKLETAILLKQRDDLISNRERVIGEINQEISEPKTEPVEIDQERKL